MYVTRLCNIWKRGKRLWNITMQHLFDKCFCFGKRDNSSQDMFHNHHFPTYLKSSWKRSVKVHQMLFLNFDVYNSYFWRNIFFFNIENYPWAITECKEMCYNIFTHILYIVCGKPSCHYWLKSASDIMDHNAEAL